MQRHSAAVHASCRPAHRAVFCPFQPATALPQPALLSTNRHVFAVPPPWPLPPRSPRDAVGGGVPRHARRHVGPGRHPLRLPLWRRPLQGTAGRWHTAAAGRQRGTLAAPRETGACTTCRRQAPAPQLSAQPPNRTRLPLLLATSVFSPAGPDPGRAVHGDSDPGAGLPPRYPHLPPAALRAGRPAGQGPRQAAHRGAGGAVLVLSFFQGTCCFPGSLSCRPNSAPAAPGCTCRRWSLLAGARQPPPSRAGAPAPLPPPAPPAPLPRS